MAAKTLFACTECGAQSPKWTGRCGECGSWNSLVEERASAPGKALVTVAARQAPSILDASPAALERSASGLQSFDALLGGGIVPGSVVLMAGDPGIGKSTLLTQIAGLLADSGRTALYLSGEESASQVRLRAERLGAMRASFRLASCTDLGEALSLIEGTSPELVIVDSIQTLTSSELQSAAGSVTQVRDCATALQRVAKERSTAVVLVGHVTKEGSLAGPKVLEHVVDTVLHFEGEGFGRLRTVRATKNRFGSIDEIAVFEMTDRGLEEVANPSAAMLAERHPDAPGSVVFPALEGSRALLVEVQSLASPNYTNNPRRSVTGLDFNRLMMVLGVIEKRCGVRVGGHDIYVNVVGGLSVREPAADLAMLLAILSSLKDSALPPDLVAFGEIGLTGEIRSVAAAELRLKEAARNGFKRAAVSKGLKASTAVSGIKVGAFRSVRDAMSLIA